MSVLELIQLTQKVDELEAELSQTQARLAKAVKAFRFLHGIALGSETYSFKGDGLYLKQIIAEIEAAQGKEGGG